MNKYGTILIADDNDAILTAMRYLLDGVFAQVLTTTSPDDILKMMAQQPVDIVLLDMNFTLGVNTGNEGLFWLRAIRKQHPQTPVVLLTAYAVRGLDINTSYTIYNLMTEQKMKGVAVIFVGEDLDVLLELCDRILVINSGAVTGIVDARTATKEEIGLLMTKTDHLRKEEA